jgi:aminoglycoside N3'-acetyltransferase
VAAVEHAGAALDGAELERGLRGLGLREGMLVEVHSSLSSFGRVAGGATTVVETLKRIVTPAGAIIMSAFPVTKPLELSPRDRELGITFKIRRLDPDGDEPTGMGAIADAFRRSPGVRTGEGNHRVCAWGTEQEGNSRGFNNLIEHDGHGLLLGVDIYSLTSMHYVESRLPDAVEAIFRPSAAALACYPEDQWCIMGGNPPVKAWHKIQDQAMRNGSIREAKIGAATCRLFRVNEVIQLYRIALETDPLGLFGLSGLDSHA